jgi:hypothetical protein
MIHASIFDQRVALHRQQHHLAHLAQDFIARPPWLMK